MPRIRYYLASIAKGRRRPPREGHLGRPARAVRDLSKRGRGALTGQHITAWIVCASLKRNAPAVRGCESRTARDFSIKTS